MADHSKPTNTSLYTNYTTELDARFDDLAVGLDPAVTTATNIPTNTIRWNSVNSYWEKYNGSTWAVLDTGYEIDLAGARKITTNSASPALTITQTGAGNALVVEDSASTDSTPFVIDNAGNVGISGQPRNPYRLTVNDTAATAAIFINTSDTASSASVIALARSRTTGGIVSSGDTIGTINFSGDDNSGAFIRAAAISAQVDGTPGTNDMPGRLIFSTTADGASTPTERMRITSNGDVGIGRTPTAKLDVLANTSTDAVRITQTGSGNSFVVEDLASPDGSPFVIDASGNVVVGNTAPIILGAGTPKIQAHGTSATSTNNGIAVGAWANSAVESTFSFMKSRGAVGNYTSVANNDRIGRMFFYGADGTSLVPASSITGEVDGTPATNDMPGRLIFSTTAAGASTPTERMRITSSGEVFIAGTTDQGAYNLQCNGTGVWGAGAYVNGSDARIKNNITPLDTGLDVVAKLNPVTYTYKEEWSKDQSIQTGFIAQELLVALEGKDYIDGIVQQNSEYMSVAYQNIIPILTKAIQEQQEMIKQLQADIAELKGA